ncbi:MAG: hypothetical protein JWM98_2352 [Thermoleophilia bacterium]|nr:hypothetical protein [Thermoleophilia bacterium]
MTVALITGALLGAGGATAQATVTPIPYSGSFTAWTAPTTGTYVFTLWGAAGGDDSLPDKGPAGLGAKATFQIAVTSGAVYRFYVGGQGHDGTDGVGAGGYNGGGGAGYSANGEYAGGGGGATDVRVAPFGLADRIAVAGGGGGSSAAHGGTPDLGTGGAGGAPVGSAGTVGSNTGVDAGLGGGGGTASAGGTGGAGGAVNGFAGEAGSLGTGGFGGNADTNAGGGAGGGGGRYGGGGGGTGRSDPGISHPGGGAGGGSSFGPVGVTYLAGARAGDGEASVSTVVVAPSSLTTSAATTQASVQLRGTVSDPSTTIEAYATSDCTGALLGSGAASDFTGAAGIAATPIGEGVTNAVYVRAVDAGGAPSACSTVHVDVTLDTTPPPLPAITFAPDRNFQDSPPTGDLTPTVSGTIEAGSVLAAYDHASCTGGVVATRSPAQLAAGFDLAAAANVSTIFSFSATDAAGNVSTCRGSYPYVTDTVAPAAPTGLRNFDIGGFTTPRSNSAQVGVGANGEVGGSVTFYATADCTGAVIEARVPAIGIDSHANSTVDTPTVADSTMYFSAVGFDAADNASPCTTISYVADMTAPGVPTGLAVAPTTPNQNRVATVTGAAEAGSFVMFFRNPVCTTSAGVGTAATLASGLSVQGALNATTTFWVLINDDLGNQSACLATGLTFTHDDVAPATPTAVALTSATPANDNAPRLHGTAEAGSTVHVFRSAACFGAAVGVGAASDFAGAGIAAVVADDAVTVLAVQATDAAGNASPCSALVTYVEDSSTVTPELAAMPASMSTATVVRGTSEDGATVRVHASGDCSGAVVAEVPNVAFTTTGVAVAGAANATSAFSVRATDRAGNASACATGAFRSDATGPTLRLQLPAPATRQPTRTPVLRGSGGTAFGDAAMVSVQVRQGGRLVTQRTAIVGGDGAFAVAAPKLAWGRYEVTAAQADDLGNRATTPVATITLYPKATGRADTVTLTAGADTFDGLAGNDVINGGAGNDRLTGGAGRDRVSGGAGNDLVNVRDGKPGDVATCGPGRDRVLADRGDRVARDCERR